MAAAAFAALLLIVVSLPLLAVHIDGLERDREVKVFTATFDQARDLMLDRLASGVNWDPALLHMDNSFDVPWVVDMYVDPYESDVGSRLFAVFGADGQVLVAREHARPVADARVAAFRLAANGLIVQMRQREAAYHRRLRAPGPRTAADWVIGSAVVAIQGRPYLLHASLVGWDLGRVTQMHDRTPIVMFASDVATKILPPLRDRLLLQDAAVGMPGAITPGMATIGLKNEAGDVTATIDWMPERPGSHLLLIAALPLLIGLGGLTTVISVAYRQGLAATRALVSGEARAHFLANHDSLTGLPNRAFLLDSMTAALAGQARTGSTLAVLMIDLDRFKLVNDTYGHQCGDELIQHVANRLVRLCAAGEICARLGGDEFVILCPGRDAVSAAERLLAALADPIRLSVAELHTGASIGISISTAGESDPGNLLRQADLALYKAKEDGRGVFRFFVPEMDQAVRNRRGLEAELRRALADRAIHLAYQPQFDGDRMVGVEALARWTHPERGPISPAFFAPLAEEFGLIEELGRQVLQQAFADSRLWPGLKVSINVSAMQLRLRSFAPRLAVLVAEAGVDATRFELEITEGVLLVDDAITQATLRDIRDMGFTLALDDFGTGYSSLSYVRRFPIDRIKIDKSFIATLAEDREAEGVVRAIIRLAQALGLGVVAEGVETKEQRQLLARMGCHVIQGYLMGRPVPAAAISEMLSLKLAG